jgi:hypothetical protein
MKTETQISCWDALDYERAARRLCFQIMTEEQMVLFVKIWESEYLTEGGCDGR